MRGKSACDVIWNVELIHPNALSGICINHGKLLVRIDKCDRCVRSVATLDTQNAALLDFHDRRCSS